MSPDGLWTWDGNRWVPAFPGASQETPVPPQSAGWQQPNQDSGRGWAPQPYVEAESADGQWQWNGQQWAPTGLVQGDFGPPPRKKGLSGGVLAALVVGGVLCLLAVVAVVAVVAIGQGSQTPTVLMQQSGTGSAKLPVFTTDGPWVLEYSFQNPDLGVCALAVSEGGTMLANTKESDLRQLWETAGPSLRTESARPTSTGEHSLEVSSLPTCHWQIRAIRSD